MPTKETTVTNVGIRSKIEGELFEACDKKASFCLVNDHEVTIKRPGLNIRCSYTLVKNSMQDVFSLLKGYLNRDELWYQVGESEVVDPDHTLLYRKNAPELAVIKQMWWYADLPKNGLTSNTRIPLTSSAVKIKTRPLNTSIHLLLNKIVRLSFLSKVEVMCAAGMSGRR